MFTGKEVLLEAWKLKSINLFGCFMILSMIYCDGGLQNGYARRGCQVGGQTASPFKYMFCCATDGLLCRFLKQHDFGKWSFGNNALCLVWITICKILDFVFGLISGERN